ncbi:hypothetical protein HDU98_008485 [Podochytrium sp. JEL0797]|nr:hypothetical protein HDU98_008485 [Podochytrium sp. JEL0797]
MIVTSNNTTQSTFRTLSTEYPTPSSTHPTPTNYTSFHPRPSVTSAHPSDPVVATCAIRPVSASAAGVSAAYCFTLGTKTPGGGRHQGGGGGGGLAMMGVGSGVGGYGCVGKVGEGVGEDAMGSFAFINEMEGALESARERAVQVVSIRAKTVGEEVMLWPGFLTDRKTMFIHVPLSFLQPVASAAAAGSAGGGGFGFRESVVAVLELAEDVLGVQSLVVCLDKDREDLATLIRSFLFVGFELVHPSVYDATNKFVLVGSSF